MSQLMDTQGRVEGVALSALAAQFGTPSYVYSRAALERAFAGYRDALAAHGLAQRSLVCFAVKANSNLAVLNVFARLGAGFDIVSGGELARVIAAGGDPAKVIFSGVAKSRDEMRAGLCAGIHCFNVESISELHTLNSVAGEMGQRAPVSLRVNPNVDAKTHPYISTGLKSNKFGVAFDDALAVYRLAAGMAHIELVGIDCHIGSQLLDPAPAAEATDKLIDLVDTLALEGIALRHIDVGGGMGITYQASETAPSMADYLAPILSRLAGRSEQVVLEPGRSLVGNAGLLLTQVRVLKPGEVKNFAIVDAAMNDLARPALYDAWHDIVTVPSQVSAGDTAIAQAKADEVWQIVGPICESGDFLGHDRTLALAEGDLLAILSAGAYGMVMSSNYNTRPRAAEVMVDGDTVHLVRERETVAALFAGERVLPG
jgi:diaminopimelate decarboxylase